MKITLRDERTENSRYVVINGVMTKTSTLQDYRSLVFELVPGEDGFPERADYYSTGKQFIPQRLSVSWHRKDGGDWEFGTVIYEGQGFAKDGKTLLKGRGRRDNGTIGQRWPIMAGETEPPAWVIEMSHFWAPHDPNLGWPQPFTEEKE